MFVGAVVVEDKVNLRPPRRLPVDGVQKRQELGVRVARVAPQDDVALEDIQGGKERGRAVPLIVVGLARRHPGPQAAGSAACGPGLESDSSRRDPGGLGIRLPVAAATLAAATILAGCASTTVLMPTPRIYIGHTAKPLFTRQIPESGTPVVDLLYVTDRAPVSEADGVRNYSSERSRSMAFGSVSVEIGERVSWASLVEESTVSVRKAP